MGSTNSNGMDLDIRPQGMHRETMGMWLQTCSQCAYTCYDIDEKPIFDVMYWKSTEYQNEKRKNVDTIFQHIDVLRRAGLFEKALEYCKSIVVENEFKRKILAFQERSVKKKMLGATLYRM